VAIDLSFNDSQRLLQTSAHEYFRRRCPTSVIREIEAGELGYEPEMWREMADLGWLGINLPEAYGGAGGGFLDVYPLYEEMGRCLVPSPHLDSVIVSGETILRAGSEDQKQRMLPGIAAGSLIVSPAIFEPGGSFGPGGVTMLATRHGGEFVLEGTKLLVGFASSADSFLCAARTGDTFSSDGISLFLVDGGTKGLSWTRLRNVAGAALYVVEMASVRVPVENLVGEVDRGWTPLSEATTRAAVLQTASIVGAAHSVLEMTNQYAKDREQFGNPIGRYQAIQYMVSNILIDLHRADLLAKQAAYLIDADKPFAREASIAVAFGKTAAAHLNRDAHEVHAGVGFILDHDLNLFSRRSKYWENNLGDARYYHEQLAVEMAS